MTEYSEARRRVRATARDDSVLAYAQAHPIFSDQMVADAIGCHLFVAQAILTRMLHQDNIRCYDQTWNPSRVYYGAYAKRLDDGTLGKNSKL